MNEFNSLGLSIKKYRQSKKISRKELAEKIGLSIHTIEKYEQGQRTPNIEILIKIAEALDITIEELIKGEIEDTKKHWEALKDFQITDIKDLLEELKKLSLTKSDKNILCMQENNLNIAVYLYEQLLQPLSKELLTGDTDIIYGDKQKASIQMIKSLLDNIENTLKTIKDKYI